MSAFYFEPDPLWYIANNELCSRRLYQREWLVLKRLLREGESISEEQHLFSSVFCPNILGCGFAANKQLTELQMEKIVHFNCCQTHNSLTVWRLEYDKKKKQAFWVTINMNMNNNTKLTKFTCEPNMSNVIVSNNTKS